MGILGRLLLLLYVLAVMAALVVSAGVCLHFIPAQTWQDTLNWLIGRQETLAVLAVMFLASLCLLSMALSSKRKVAEVVDVSDDIELEKGNSGEVKVTVPALVGVVERAALNVVGVRQASANVAKKSGEVPVKVQLEIALSQNYAAPEISGQVKDSVNAALKTVLQIPNVPVEIKVVEITHAVIEREKRVV